MRWLAAIVVLLLVATVPVSDAWAKGRGRDGDKGKNGDGDKGKGDCRETPDPTPTAANVPAERENSVVWYVMDRTDPTRRLAGPFYIEQACKASMNGYNNAVCRAVRD
jgi:hypothetical protein